MKPKNKDEMSIFRLFCKKISIISTFYAPYSITNRKVIQRITMFSPIDMLK